MPNVLVQLERFVMSNYNWCHNPDCHTIQTQSRVRGSGNNKVLRTRKIKVYNPDDPHVWDFFCNNNCLFSFLRKFAREVANLNPTTKPKETPIKVTTHTYDDTYPSYYEGKKYKTITKLQHSQE